MKLSPEEVGKLGAGFFGKDYQCAESVLLGIAKWRGVESELVPGIASGFCSGISRTCGMCGAVSGGIMALGLCNGKIEPGESLDDLYSLVQDFKKRFMQLHDSDNCRELISVDLSTESGRNAYREQDLYGTCRGFVADASKIVAELIEGYERRAFDL